MQPFTAAMLRVREAFYAAIVKSLLRTKSLLQTILNIWISPSSIVKEETVDAGGKSDQKKVKDFMDGVEREFRGRTRTSNLVALSEGLREEFYESLLENPQCMLPSYIHQLPTGRESGTYMALDVGGSTFRVALVELTGLKNGAQKARILELTSFKIGHAERLLKGVAFFDWMADRVGETLSKQKEGQDLSEAPLSVGLSWSFAIEQTSLRSGLLLGMGKEFLAAEGLLGQDLGDLIQDSCSRKGLNIQLNAILNDSSATLLSKAYIDPTTHFALILGTGVNAAVHLPVHIFSPTKFGIRPSSWHESAKHVVVNTELSMFGGAILPFTKWDEILKSNHLRPNFQPLEYFVSGGYLGEIARLVLIDGIENAGLFGGIVPPSLKEKNSLDTQTLSFIEADRSPALSSALQLFVSRHPSSPTQSDIQALRQIASHVSFRASALIATGVHALWQMRNEAESISASESLHTLVAYNGSVLENYPNFRVSCQKHLDALVEASGGHKGVVELMYAEESSLLGAAVAVACLDA